MQNSMWNPATRQDLLQRLAKLDSDTPALWGTMDSSRMVAHLVAWMQMIKSDIKVAPRRLPVRFPVIKQLVVYLLPFPKGLPTAPELIQRDASKFADNMSAMRRHIESFATMSPETPLPPHPAFGKLTSKAWGVLGYRHTDHHLRQFGV